MTWIRIFNRCFAVIAIRTLICSNCERGWTANAHVSTRKFHGVNCSSSSEEAKHRAMERWRSCFRHAGTVLVLVRPNSSYPVRNINNIPNAATPRLPAESLRKLPPLLLIPRGPARLVLQCTIVAPDVIPSGYSWSRRGRTTAYGTGFFRIREMVVGGVGMMEQQNLFTLPEDWCEFACPRSECDVDHVRIQVELEVELPPAPHFMNIS